MFRMRFLTSLRSVRNDEGLHEQGGCLISRNSLPQRTQRIFTKDTKCCYTTHYLCVLCVNFVLFVVKKAFHPLKYAFIPNAVRNPVHYAKLCTLSYTTAFILMMLATFAISSCKQEDAPEVDPLTLPSAQFFYEIQYRTHTDGDTYAFVTTTNNSSNSNRWKWNRPGSVETITGDREFETLKQDTIIEHAYIATAEELKYEITLIAYNDVPIGVDAVDSTIIIYETFKSHPFVQEVRVKKP